MSAVRRGNSSHGPRWPVGEEGRNREIRADVVLRLWRTAPPESPSLALIHAQVVIGLIVDFQNRIDRRKKIRVIEYQSAYPPVLGPNIFVVVMTFDPGVARWALQILDQLHPTVHRSVITPDSIARSEPIDPDKAPRRAVLEAMCHVRGPDDLELLKNALRALRYFSGNELLIYRHMLRSRIDEGLIMETLDQPDAELQAELEEWADQEPSEVDLRIDQYLRTWRALKQLREQRERDKLLGRADALLDLLCDRGFEPDPASQARILECSDPAQLRRWLARAMTIEHLDALFDD